MGSCADSVGSCADSVGSCADSVGSCADSVGNCAGGVEIRMTFLADSSLPPSTQKEILFFS